MHTISNTFTKYGRRAKIEFGKPPQNFKNHIRCWQPSSTSFRTGYNGP